MMKNIKKTISIISLTICLSLPFSVFSQAVAPPPPSDGHGSTTNQTAADAGGSAPIGGGLFILLGLGVAYGGYKGLKFYNEKKETLID